MKKIIFTFLLAASFVGTAQEKSWIEDTATRNASGYVVVNELEVTSS